MADDKEHEITVKVIDRRRWREDGEVNAEAAPQASLKPTYIEELERKLAQREKEAEEYLAKYRQASREFEDARARMRKELAKDAERSRREVLISLLEVVDNLDRAIEAAEQARHIGAGRGAPASERAGGSSANERQRESHESGAGRGAPASERAGGSGGAKPPGNNDALLEGVGLVRDQFLAKLDGFGVRRIATEGAVFNPLLHEAVSAVPAADPAQDGVIVGVVRQGYLIADEVLRPALVAVAKSAESVQ
jgi:molecular chaperone GrpE